MICKADAVEADYRRYADALGEAARRNDVVATNRNYDKLARVRARLKACGRQGEAILRRLMADHSHAIAMRAAVDSLPFAEVEALRILDTIAKGSGLIALDARMSAELWRAGKLKISLN